MDGKPDSKFKKFDAETGSKLLAEHGFKRVTSGMLEEAIANADTKNVKSVDPEAVITTEDFARATQGGTHGNARFDTSGGVTTQPSCRSGNRKPSRQR